MRGNPAGITNTHVAQNIRTARQAIGMDLRTMSDGMKASQALHLGHQQVGGRGSPRGVQLDPEGRVFNAADYMEIYADTHRPGQTTARSTLS